MSRRLVSFRSAVACASVACACSGAAELQPARDANRFGHKAAYVNLPGIQVRAQGDAWRGDPEVQRYVTPVRVSIHNAGRVPLRASYRTMALVAENGARFAGVPPLDVRGSIALRTYNEVPRYYGYYGYHPSIDGYRPWTHGYSGWYSDSVPSWPIRVSLPTQEMLDLALRDTPIPPGGSATGFVYFRPVPDSAKRVTLEIGLTDGDTSRNLGTARIPFDVE